MRLIEQTLDEIIDSAARTYPPHWSEQPYLPDDGLSEVARGGIWARIEEELGLAIPGAMIDTMQRPQDFRKFVAKMCAAVPAGWRCTRLVEPTVTLPTTVTVEWIDYAIRPQVEQAWQR
jgi:hypothetical protein